MKNLVSVIIVTLNADRTIYKAINSVKNQTYQNIELLIIDGLSKDSTLNVLKKFDNLFYISEKDKGIFDAMNKGIQYANGEWVYFLGADDELEPNAIETLIQNSEGYDIVYGNYTVVSPEGKETNLYALDYKVVRFKVFGNHQCLIMKRNVIVALDCFDITFKLAADFDLIQRAYLQNYKFKQIQACISKFSLGGVSSNNYSTSIEWWKICKKNNSVTFPILCLFYGLLRDFKNRIIYKISS
ncbi:glycosyltransferase family 2 protein [Aquirufa regiilacus]|uniref:Glycosyltransferase family 2 protein n=1 Tax=Aquirufa regiilacus TaxID=3024868 RepID=A0ABU3TTB4_9BACT|nr:glycosyltransferase family 2 protein [Aquirufa sp. LEOWEIH-7C]MDU0808902.1 glycosyltransferase family 2 protein [Aquirufa sp. LEOWEIH-7C]